MTRHPPRPLNSDINSSDPYTKKYHDSTDAAIDAEARDLHPLPIRNGLGSSILGPRNLAREQQQPDIIRPPSTDSGTLPNYKWSFTDSHMRIEEGGWARQTTIRELPTSIELAGWAYMLAGSARVTALDTEGGNFIGEVEKGDLWYFPSGHPHSIQGLGEDGCEFLLVFDDGNFSEDSTFLLSDFLAHTPTSVLGKNFRLDPEIFKMIPKEERYIFQGSMPGDKDDEMPDKPHVKKSRLMFTHKMLDQKPEVFSGGEVRITDTEKFPLSKTISAAHVTIKPGGIREMHWHPNADEWSFFIKGSARITIFASSGMARTFNYTAGDVGIVPKSMGHYVENISEMEEVEMLEIFRAPKFEDFSLEQWLGNTPGRMVAEHLFQKHPKAGKKFVEELKAGKEAVKPNSNA
ncbi:Bicupin, oxalate decarboxylase/oxidase [Mollisia scopiformis]|uniref:Bicupin, oxalate decarboxylase/oxidase n=1 Tax=Mollisia scopiformis TaxID=149040 RepID=A0A132BBG8_MOLSC|nr:Bicupin, oxalate decarboxylase/oxidase [Mollisia scopiformis]KUJ09736.1 Bicupin, oxalate decarboxylase/oxidase [Mollisia scopiformis]